MQRAALRVGKSAASQPDELLLSFIDIFPGVNEALCEASFGQNVFAFNPQP